MCHLCYIADGEFRICISISDIIDRQVDEGAKLFLDVGGEVSQRDLTVEMNRGSSVLFIIVFTKFDLIVPNVSSGHNDYEERCRSLFRNVPTDIVSVFTLSYALHIRVVSLLCLQRGRPFAILSTN